MNKMLLVIKNILLLILTIFTIKYTTLFGVYGITYIMYLGILGLLVFFSIIDIIKKRDIVLNTTYNIISIVMLLIMIFVFARTLFDQNFLFNSTKYTIEEVGTDTYDALHMYIALYLYQNLRFFIFMMVMTLLYRKINMEKVNVKYHWLSVICLFVSFYSVLPSLNCIYATLTNAILYLLFTIVLIGVEVYRLFKDNYKYRNWPIFVSFFFNMIAIVCIIINIIINVF